MPVVVACLLVACRCGSRLPLGPPLADIVGPPPLAPRGDCVDFLVVVAVPPRGSPPSPGQWSRAVGGGDDVGEGEGKARVRWPSSSASLAVCSSLFVAALCCNPVPPYCPLSPWLAHASGPTSSGGGCGWLAPEVVAAATVGELAAHARGSALIDLMLSRLPRTDARPAPANEPARRVRTPSAWESTTSEAAVLRWPPAACRCAAPSMTRDAEPKLCLRCLRSSRAALPLSGLLTRSLARETCPGQGDELVTVTMAVGGGCCAAALKSPPVRAPMSIPRLVVALTKAKGAQRALTAALARLSSCCSCC